MDSAFGVLQNTPAVFFSGSGWLEGSKFGKVYIAVLVMNYLRLATNQPFLLNGRVCSNESGTFADVVFKICLQTVFMSIFVVLKFGFK